MLPDMRRSTMWLLIACGWLVDTAIVLYRQGGRQAAITFSVVLVFVAVGLGFRRSESRKDRPEAG